MARRSTPIARYLQRSFLMFASFVLAAVVAGPALAQKSGGGGGGGGPAARGQASTVTIVNSSGMRIDVINVSPVTSSNWGNDVLEDGVLPSGRRVQVRIRDGGGCAYDLMVTYQDRQTEERRNVNLCSVENIVFNGSNARMPQQAQGPASQGSNSNQRQAQARPPSQGQGNPDFVLVNNSQMRIDVINVSPVASTDWGQDFLGNDTLAPGQRFNVRLGRPGECMFDLRVIYQDRRQEEQRNVNLCAVDQIAMTGAQARLPQQAGPQGQQPPQGGGQQAVRPPQQGQQPPQAGLAPSGPTSGTPKLVLNNTGRATINEIYVRPQGATDWGIDRLGSGTLAATQTFTLDLPPNAGCIWSLRIVFQSARPEERQNVNLCAGQPFAFAAQIAPGQLLSTGSGFYVTRQGHIMTNRHVIEGCGSVAIARPNGQRLTLRIIGEDAVNDLAILQLPGTVSPVLSSRSAASPVRAGERVIVVGYPARQVLGELNVTEGNLSALRGPRGDTTLFQYTAPTQGGNSGGPILDESGLVIGVVVSRVEQLPGGRQAQNINFGIQLDVARRFAQSLGVSLDDQPIGEPRRTPDIAERAQPAVLPLDCVS